MAMFELWRRLSFVLPEKKNKIILMVDQAQSPYTNQLMFPPCWKNRDVFLALENFFLLFFVFLVNPQKKAKNPNELIN